MCTRYKCISTLVDRQESLEEVYVSREKKFSEKGEEMLTDRSSPQRTPPPNPRNGPTLFLSVVLPHFPEVSRGVLCMGVGDRAHKYIYCLMCR